MGGNLLQYSELQLEDETGQEEKSETEREESKRREPKEKQICATDSSDKGQSESRFDRWTSQPDRDISDPEYYEWGQIREYLHSREAW